MKNWRLHWLEADGSLSDWKADIAAEIKVAESAVQSVLKTPPIDVLVAYRHEGPIIPELGLCGFSFSPSLFLLACNPENPNFDSSVVDGAIRRQVVHEVHHCLRKAGPGYGGTLGEAIISEGLAGRFVEHVLGTPPELWEKAVGPNDLMTHLPDGDVLWSTDYDHSDWFFGTRSRPRWLGYSMGYEFVGRWLRQCGRISAKDWVETPAATIFATARPSGR